MPKEETAKEPTLSITAGDLQKLFEKMFEGQLEQIKELKKPYVSEEQIAARAAEKKRFQDSEAQARAHKKSKQDRCSHLRPEDGKSLFYPIRNVFPKGGAMSLVCCRCFKLIQNHNPETGKLVQNPEFDQWVNVSRGTAMLG